MLLYCRPAVEKYIFGKLFDKLFVMYAIKNENDDVEFQQIGALIKTIRAEDTMRFLGIREKFIFERTN